MLGQVQEDQIREQALGEALARVRALAAAWVSALEQGREVMAEPQSHRICIPEGHNDCSETSSACPLSPGPSTRSSPGMSPC